MYSTQITITASIFSTVITMRGSSSNAVELVTECAGEKKIYNSGQNNSSARLFRDALSFIDRIL